MPVDENGSLRFLIFCLTKIHTRTKLVKKFRLKGLLSVAIWTEEERQRKRRYPLPDLRIQDTRWWLP